jgi:hypothetical protein
MHPYNLSQAHSLRLRLEHSKARGHLLVSSSLQLSLVVMLDTSNRISSPQNQSKLYPSSNLLVYYLGSS